MLTFNPCMRPITTSPNRLFSAFFIYFALKLTNGKSDQTQTVIDITLYVICVKKLKSIVLILRSP